MIDDNTTTMAASTANLVIISVIAIVHCTGHDVTTSLRHMYRKYTPQIDRNIAEINQFLTCPK